MCPLSSTFCSISHCEVVSFRCVSIQCESLLLRVTGSFNCCKPFEVSSFCKEVNAVFLLPFQKDLSFIPVFGQVVVGSAMAWHRESPPTQAIAAFVATAVCTPYCFFHSSSLTHQRKEGAERGEFGCKLNWLHVIFHGSLAGRVEWSQEFQEYFRSYCANQSKHASAWAAQDPPQQPIAELAALSTKVWIEQKSPKWTLHSLDGVTCYTQRLIKLTWNWKGFPDRSLNGKVVNLAGRRDALKSRRCCYMWQLLFCLDINYHGCLGAIRMNSCHKNVSSTSLGCFRPPWICQGGISLEGVGFFPKPSHTPPADQAGLDPPQLYMLLSGKSINPAEPAASEMVRLKQHLSDCPREVLGQRRLQQIALPPFAPEQS